MEFKDLIVVRRSVRDYVSAADHEALVGIVREAQQAPSWKNQQTARCYVVETPEILEDYEEELNKKRSVKGFFKRFIS